MPLQQNASVRRMVSMISWQRKRIIAFGLGIAGCSSPQSVAVAGAAGGSDVGTAAPRGSFRASLVPCDTLSAVRAREVVNRESMSLRRGRDTGVSFPKGGDTVLVDVTSYDEQQQLIERVNAFGVLQSRKGDTWSVREIRTRRRLAVRLSEDSWVRAPRGVYRLRTTGEVVGQPAYHVWTTRYASLPATGCVVGYRVGP